MPASFGFHPAFRWPLPYGQPREQHHVVFAEPEPAPIRRLDGDGLVKPDAVPTPVTGRELALRDALFVDDAVIFDALRSRSVWYGAPGATGLTVDFADLPDFAIWTKPGAGYICLEPWQGHADPQGFAGDIIAKPGVIILAPGEERRLTMRVRLG
jgi:galactose mutarotase-like enzyme